MNYSIKFHKEAKRELDKLDGSQRISVIKQINKLVGNPFCGIELGNKGGCNLSGLRKLYVDNKKIRIVYKILEEQVIVYIISIGKRDKDKVYIAASKRTN